MPAKMYFKSKQASEKVNDVIKILSADLRSNKYEKGELQFTDLTNKDYFIKAYGDIVRYCPLWKKFLVWNGSYWEIDNKNTVPSMAVNFIHKMYRGIRVIKDTGVMAAFEKHLLKSEQYCHITALINLIKLDENIIVSPDELDSNVELFTSKSITINLNTGKGYEAKSSDLITKSGVFDFVKGQGCPVWDNFLLEIFCGDKDLITYIQKVIGSCLYGKNTEQNIYILLGSGANGKSTFINTIQFLMGNYAGTTASETFLKKNSDTTNDLASLRGLRLVTTSEVSQGTPLNESLVKQITGGDSITARFLYGEYFTYKPGFKIFLSSNHKPYIKGSDWGIWRRIKIIPFNKTIPKEKADKELAEKLINESAGIFNWMLNGWFMLKEQGLEDPSAVTEAIASYKQDMNPFDVFMNTCLFVKQPDSVRCSAKNIYGAYIKWCNLQGEKPVYIRSLILKIQEAGYKKYLSNGITCFHGLCVRAEWLMN